MLVVVIVVVETLLVVIVVAACPLVVGVLVGIVVRLLGRCRLFHLGRFKLGEQLAGDFRVFRREVFDGDEFVAGRGSFAGRFLLRLVRGQFVLVVVVRLVLQLFEQRHLFGRFSSGSRFGGNLRLGCSLRLGGLLGGRFLCGSLLLCRECCRDCCLLCRSDISLGLLVGSSRSRFRFGLCLFLFCRCHLVLASRFASPFLRSIGSSCRVGVGGNLGVFLFSRRFSGRFRCSCFLRFFHFFCLVLVGGVDFHLFTFLFAGDA